MRHSKALLLLTVCLLCVVLTAAALTDGPLPRLWDSGCAFLFHTDNVTVDGTAVFSMDGERFKTAELHYVQDGCSSFYGLKLLTPRKDTEDQQTGWTIIADAEGNYYVMEKYTPSIYRTGTGSPNNTLLRRSVELDALTELGGLLVGQVEPLLPEGTVAVTEKDGQTATHIALAADQIPDLAASALNLAAGFLSDRWFSYSHDRSWPEGEQIAFDNYVTVTEALTDATVRWTLRKADVDFVTDSQNRLTAARGDIAVTAAIWDGTEREVTVHFDLAMTDYGSSTVQPFHPEDYNVVLPWEADPDDWRDLG